MTDVPTSFRDMAAVVRERDELRTEHKRLTLDLEATTLTAKYLDEGAAKLRAEVERLRAENAELQESLEEITLKVAMLQSSA